MLYKWLYLSYAGDMALLANSTKDMNMLTRKIIEVAGGLEQKKVN